MKIFVILAVLLGGVAFAPAMQLDAKTWGSLEKIDVSALRKDLDGHVGRLVELRCEFRGKDIHHQKPGWYESSVWQGGGERRFVDVRVMFSQHDLAAFKSLPTTGGGEEITLYGKVLRDSEAHFVFVRLIGRNAVVDQKGKANITW
jgi:hypothetical protein